MKRKKLSTTLYVTLEQAVALHLLSAKSGAPVAHFIRTAIDEWLARAIADGRIAREDLPRSGSARAGTVTTSTSLLAGYTEEERQAAFLILLDGALGAPASDDDGAA